MANRVHATLTNLETGPRGIATATGLVMIEAGAEAGVDLAPAELEAAARSGWFAVATRDAPLRPRRRGTP